MKKDPESNNNRENNKSKSHQSLWPKKLGQLNLGSIGKLVKRLNTQRKQLLESKKNNKPK